MEEWIRAKNKEDAYTARQPSALPAAASALVAANGALLAARNRNKLNNGSFRVNQRGIATAVVLLPGRYGFDRWKASGHENLITNPSAETNTTGLSTNACTLTRVNTWASTGSWSYQLALSGANSFIHFGGDVGGGLNGFIPGRTYTASMTLRLTAPLTGAQQPGLERGITLHTNTGAGYVITASTPVPNVAGVTRTSFTFTIPQNANQAFIRFYAGHAAGTAWMDDLMVTETTFLTPYFDGSTGGGAIWQGTAHASISQSQASTTLTFTTAPQGQLVTISDGGGLLQVIERADVQAEASVFSWAGTATGRTFTHDAAGYAAPPALAASPITFTPGGLTDRIVEVRAVGGSRTFGLAQFELGSVPTPFERILLADDLRACQRFFVRFVHVTGADSAPLGSGMQTSTTASAIMVPLPTPMRIRPFVVMTVCHVSDRVVHTTLVTLINSVRGGLVGAASVGLDLGHASAGAQHRPALLILPAPGSAISFDSEF